MQETHQRAFKTKLRPTSAQKVYFVECAGVARFAFNWGLAEWERQFNAGEKPRGRALRTQLNAIKHEVYPWLTNYPYTVFEQAFDHLQNSFDNYWRQKKDGTVAKRIEQKKKRGTWNKHLARCLRKGRKGIQIDPGYPQFKSRFDDKKFQMRGCAIEYHRVRLPRIGWVILAEKGYIPPTSDPTVKLNTVTISEKAGSWYASAQYELPLPEPPPLDGTIGIDLGIKNLVVTSDGETFDNPRALARHEKQLARLQREFSRRKPGSSNRAKTKAKIARLNDKISNIRRHMQHNVSAHVTHNMTPETVVVEDLNVDGMKTNKRLAKAVSDSGMGEIRRQIEYKAGWIGTDVVVADRWFPSSKTCSNCGSIREDLTLSDRVFSCNECGLVIDRDHNAALNLAGLADRRAHAV